MTCDRLHDKQSIVSLYMKTKVVQPGFLRTPTAKNALLVLVSAPDPVVEPRF